MKVERCNFTGRQDISLKSIKAEVFAGPPRFLRVVDLNLNEYTFPSKAEVNLDITCAGSPHIQRIPLGYVGHIDVEKDFTLDNELTIGKNREQSHSV